MSNKLKSLLAVAILGMSSAAMAVPITIDDTDAGAADGTDVGLLDLIRATATPNLGSCGPGSSEAAEECWAEAVLGIELELSGKEEDVQSFSTSVDDVIAFALQYGPGYYIIKNATTWILMENLSSIDWGVLDLVALNTLTETNGFGNLGEGVIISHVTEFNGGGDMKVSEPGTLALFGLALLGMGFARRNTKTA